MTYHMQCARRTLDFGETPALEFEEESRVLPFPAKLWQVVQDKSSHMIEWTNDGEAIVVDDVLFEAEVMTTYPGFVKISTFANLRRQLREYGFEWILNERGELEFSHPNFKRDTPNVLPNVLTKRKSLTRLSSRRGVSDFGVIRHHRRIKPQQLMPDLAPDGNIVNPTCNQHILVAEAPAPVKNITDDTYLRPRFPEKLWDIVNDQYQLLVWSCDGKSYQVSSEQFEREVMFLYPGFLQTPSFLNFRRLMREYGFAWCVKKNDVRDFQFSHPCFVRDKPELLTGILTKRKRHLVGKLGGISRICDSSTPEGVTFTDQNKLEQQSPQFTCERNAGGDSTVRNLETSIPWIQTTNHAFGDCSGLLNDSEDPLLTKEMKPKEKVVIPIYFWKHDDGYSANADQETKLQHSDLGYQVLYDGGQMYIKKEVNKLDKINDDQEFAAAY